ncbi:MAG TPA: hypothetical protein VFH72_11290 [Candidatus Baltobacteraceae bacterium]|nr:hypothetical protein [Candidatus Baltobacteraceae bacterium]
MRIVYALTAIAFWVLACVPEYALAFTPVLSRSQVAAATSDGQRMEKKQRGYQAPQNILFAAPDTLRIRVGQSPVDAIIVGTPYERLRYASYLRAFQGQPPSMRSAESTAAQDANVLQMVLFVHSSSAADRGFLQRYSSGALQFGNRVVRAERVDTFGPALDYYDVDGAGRQFRFVGSVTFRFDLSGMRASGVDIATATGTFSFSDAHGVTRRYPIALSRYP